MKQIYTLTIEFEHFWDEDDEWRRVVEVEDSMELYDLHLFIQEVVEFDNDHLFEFFLGTSRRNRKVAFGDDGGFGNGEVYGLDTELKEIFPLGGLKFYYHFDFGDDWIFRIKKSRKIGKVDPKVEYPRVIEKIGENPEQYPDYDE